ncbi:MAG: winged helix-turn-helix transcriptional regulator [Candidatus Thermoplasmatota archaeon]|nr:winged helix-turn-helix transcriptional regulator [Candidatus Thermoplasmatota archaeon]
MSSKKRFDQSISFIIVIVAALSFASIPDSGSARTTEQLLKGNTPGEFFDLEFPQGGGRDSSVSISVPDSGPVMTSSLIISTVEGSAGPDSIFIDIGSDERSEWTFGGAEEGAFGLQNSFVNGKKVIRDSLNQNAVIYSFFLPQGSDILSSGMWVSSPPSPEVEGIRSVFGMGKDLLSVDAVDAGDIDLDGELELVYFDPRDDCIYAIDVEEGQNTSKVALVEDVPGVTTLTVIEGSRDCSNGILFSMTENGEGSVGMLLGNDLENMERMELSSGLPANSSGYCYNRDTGLIHVLSGLSGRIMRVSMVSGDKVNTTDVLDASINGSAIAEADLDGDGDQDLVVFPGVSSGSNVTICASSVENGTEVLTLDDTGIPLWSESIAAVLDIDGDGKEEIYISMGLHKRIASLYLDGSGSMSLKWIGLNNTDGRPRSLPRESYGDGSIFQGPEGLLYISTYDGLYHVLPRDGPESDHIWRKSLTLSSLAMICRVEDGYKVAAIGTDNSLFVGNAMWSSGSDVVMRSVEGDVNIEVVLDATEGKNVDISHLVLMGDDRPMKVTPSGNILLRYDIAITGSDGFLSMTALRIDYDVRMDASSSVSFNPAIQKVVDTSDLIDIPITVRATSEGVLRIGPVKMRYDSPPDVLPTLPRTLSVKEGSSGTSLFNIRDHIQDDDLLPQGLDVEIIPGPDLPPSLLFFDRNGNLVVQPFMFPDLNGEFLFALTVSDLRSTVQTEPISLIIEPTPDSPVLVGGVDEMTIMEGGVSFIQLSGEGGMFMDPDGDLPLFTCSIADPQPLSLRDTVEIEFINDTIELLAPISGSGGSFRLEITASDGSGESDPAMGAVKVNILNNDAPPLLGRNPGPVTLMEDQDTPSRVPLSGWFLDPDTELSGYEFDVYSPVARLEADIKDAGGEPYLSLLPTGNLNGEYSLMVEMTSEGTIIVDRLKVDIKPVADVPRVFMDGKDLLENRGWLLNGHVSDPDSDTGIIEYRIGDGDWMTAWGFESWSLVVDFRSMPTGSAFVFIRAFDGEEYSIVTYIKLSSPEEQPLPIIHDPGTDVPDDDDDGDDPFLPGDDEDLVPHEDNGRDAPWLLYGGIAGVLLSLLAFFGFTEVGMVVMFTMGVTLYSKLSKKDILNHEVRGLIRGYIIANPGDHYSSIKRNLDLNNGTLAYHLRVLEQSGFIKSMYDGIYKRYYPSNVNISKLKKNVSKQEEIFNIILENPGVTMEQIGHLIGVSRQVVNYHVKNLIRAGVVSYLRDQKSAKFFPIDQADHGFET